jgi:quinol monooxygenase YgiN
VLISFQVVELLNEVSKYIIKNEPGTLRYEITREKNKKTAEEQIVMIERSDSSNACGDIQST